MTANESLITVDEILNSTPGSQGKDPRNIKVMMLQQEESLFRVWLGMDFYKDLMSDKTDMSAATQYVEGFSYTIGAKVRYDGIFYTCIQATSSELPTNSAFWKLTEKFSNESYTYLWDRYMKTVISWFVLHTGVVYEAIRITQLGVQRTASSETGQRATSAKELSHFKNEIGVDANMFLQNMDRYLRDNSETFPNYRPNKLSGQRASGKPIKNYGFTTW